MYFCSRLNKLKSITNIVIWTVIGFIVTFMVLLQLPATQAFLGSKVASALSEKFGTEVSVGRVGIGIPNRITIDDVRMLDKLNKPLLGATRISAKVDLPELFKDKIVITSAQLFGLDANLYHDPKTGKANYQFVLDSLASKDNKEKTPLDLKINSLVIRNGSIAYDDRKISDLSAHFILDALKDDLLNLKIKRLSFKEANGLELTDLQAKIVADRQRATISDFLLRLPNSELVINEAKASYKFIDGKFQPASLQYAGSIEPSSVRPSDLKSLLAELSGFDSNIHISGNLLGTASSLSVSKLNIYADDNSLRLLGEGSVSNFGRDAKWATNIADLQLSTDGIKHIAEAFARDITVPQEVIRLGNIHYSGTLGGYGRDIALRGTLNTDAGEAQLAIGKTESSFTGRISTKGFNLQRLLADNRFGQLSTDIDVDGRLLAGKISNLFLKGMVSHFDYNGYPFTNISVDGTLANKTFDGTLRANDPNAQFDLTGTIALPSPAAKANLIADVRMLNPFAMNLTRKWRNTSFSGNIVADIKGSSVSTLNGSVDLRNFEVRRYGMRDERLEMRDERLEMRDEGLEMRDGVYTLNHLLLNAENTSTNSFLSLESDFANVQLKGKYDYLTIAQSINNLIANKLPTLPGLSKKKSNPSNNFELTATIYKGDFFEQVLGIPVSMTQPVSVTGSMNDYLHTLNMQAEIPDITYKNSTYTNGKIDISSPNDTLLARLSFDKPQANGGLLALKVNAKAADNKLSTTIDFDNQGQKPIRGSLNADAQFFETELGTATAHVDIHTSEIIIGDTVWTVLPGNIIYSENDLLLDHVAVRHGQQHIIIDGHATKSANDSVTVDMKDINVAYILNFVNFRSISFGGFATGQAYVSSVFGTPQASADLQVSEFTFQQGHMGTLFAKARYNNEKEQIDIDAVAKESPLAQTIINGYISPQRKDLDLNVAAQNTSVEFMEGFCGTFMRDVNASAVGNVTISGGFKQLNLLGSAVVNGTIGISSLNTTYVLRNDTVNLRHGEISFLNDTIYDLEGHRAVVDGILRHNHLKNMTYDVDIAAENLLAYDFKEFGENTFCGTVWGTGICKIKGKSGEVNIDVDVTPDKGSVIVYNAASPDAIRSQEFIQWRSKQDDGTETEDDDLATNMSAPALQPSSMATNIHINFLIRATPVSTLQVLMDEASGDYIALNGNGILRATYYNKGAFNMYGNYNVDGGIYKMSIQNVIKKDFQFQSGGSIAFRGDPYNADLKLKAQYTVNGVSLSDLNIGRSFTSNNIRVNCLMDIVGTPYQPRVEFSLDLPTISSEAKNMIFSLINSEQEMNQQVLYLLAIGRFYNQGANNATADGSPQQSQTSLAMQSILSGTISGQINNILSSFINNNNWNFGANISTGDEGFNNAEYEGLLSGRLLNNRLQINGEFGYRDNPNATTSFIGDFDIRYLLFPNGNAAIKVYNQTNDRYFTRNSLNTQGVGLILKKDFNGWKDFWGIGRKRKKK